MCHACVTDAVKQRMLSRREFFKAAPAAAIGAGVAMGAAPAALAQGHQQVVDLTHTVSPEFPTYFGAPGISAEQKFNFADNGFNLFEITVNEHTGTHIDAPLHFSADGQSVDEIPIENLVCPLAVIDIREKAAAEKEATVTPDDLKAWIGANGEIPEGACVAMLSGWAGHVGTDKYRGADTEGVQHYPGFHIEAAQMLIEETGAVGMAVDTLSLDVGSSKTFETHYAWLPTNRWGAENVANLDAVPAAGADIGCRRAEASGRQWRPGADHGVGVMRSGGTYGCEPPPLWMEMWMATVSLLTDAELSPEAQAVFAEIRAARGSDFVNDFWRALAHDPAVVAGDVGSVAGGDGAGGGARSTHQGAAVCGGVDREWV